MTTTTTPATTGRGWIHPALRGEASWDAVDCLCVGTGRFLRATLVPLLTRHGRINSTVLVQPRGQSFVQHMIRNSANSSSGGTYQVDTVLRDGGLETSDYPVAAAYSWGTREDWEAFVQEILPRLSKVCVIGVGVTEAGLSSAQTPVLQALYRFFQCLWQQQTSWQEQDQVAGGTTGTHHHRKYCVIDMDNVPNNGATIQAHLRQLADADGDGALRLFLDSHVVFLDSMVDRITSQREGSGGLVPRAEPVPAKALVVLDPHGDVPPWLAAQVVTAADATDDPLGLVIRTSPEQLQADLALKLRIANGTHTALAHLMALLQLTQTDALADGTPWAGPLLGYVDALCADQILPATRRLASPAEATATWEDWRSRLTHKHFGLSTYFITQNGPAKGGIRLGPTVVDLVQTGREVTVAMAWAYAILLRWLTPAATAASPLPVYRGWLPHTTPDATTVSYADGLRYDFDQGWYEFKCACPVMDPTTGQARNLADWLAMLHQDGVRQPSGYLAMVRAYLAAPAGGNQEAVAGKAGWEDLVQAIATLYARMVAGDDLPTLLRDIQESQAPYAQAWSTPCAALVEEVSMQAGRPLYYRPHPVPSGSILLQTPVALEEVATVIASEVAGVETIDLHTHLLPPTHGPLCLWGIDELLTYHYLVAEYFMTAPANVTPDDFYEKTKREQADLIWQALFLDRSPISEACRGVVTTLVSLGLQEEVRARNLTAIRAFYVSYRDRGVEGAAAFSDLVFAKAGVRYNIMTNIPFNCQEAQYWRPEPVAYSSHYRSALRVDPLLAGDRSAVEVALKASGYEVTLEGARQYLRDWCDTIKPEYMMASTPHDFVLAEGTLANVQAGGVNEEAMKEPGAFAKAQVGGDDCSPVAEDSPTVINEDSDFVSQVLMKVCEERNLPLALKIGSHRAINPSLKAAGDGMVAFADAGVLARVSLR
jgi:mannitol-1-phosphate/altronate dehydrogenase